LDSPLIHFIHYQLWPPAFILLVILVILVILVASSHQFDLNFKYFSSRNIFNWVEEGVGNGAVDGAAIY